MDINILRVYVKNQLGAGIKFTLLLLILCSFFILLYCTYVNNDCPKKKT
jgi:ABC-type multidrug transport system permease subunit